MSVFISKHWLDKDPKLLPVQELTLIRKLVTVLQSGPCDNKVPCSLSCPTSDWNIHHLRLSKYLDRDNLLLLPLKDLQCFPWHHNDLPICEKSFEKALKTHFGRFIEIVLFAAVQFLFTAIVSGHRYYLLLSYLHDQQHNNVLSSMYNMMRVLGLSSCKDCSSPCQILQHEVLHPEVLLEQEKVCLPPPTPLLGPDSEPDKAGGVHGWDTAPILQVDQPPLCLLCWNSWINQCPLLY